MRSGWEKLFSKGSGRWQLNGRQRDGGTVKASQDLQFCNQKLVRSDCPEKARGSVTGQTVGSSFGSYGDLNSFVRVLLLPGNC